MSKQATTVVWGGLAALLLTVGSFWIALKVMDYLEAKPAQTVLVPTEHQSTKPTALMDLPAFRPEVHNFIKWAEVVGLNVEEVKAPSIVRGQPILDLAPVPPSRYHRLGVTFSYVSRHRPHRVSLWIKGSPGTQVAVEANDQSLAKNGSAVYDLTNIKVSSVQGALEHAAIKPGAGGWLLASFDMQAPGGAMTVFLRLLGRDASWVFESDPAIQVLLGGIEIDSDD
jgi:hypothetical protein